jgi:hypothetical protein
VTFREHHTWHRVSSDGYYAIDHELDDLSQVTGFECFHIEAVWATPVSIGRADALDAAEKLCHEHNTRPRAA